MNDNVNHPNHYTQGSIECIEAIKAATVGKTGIEAICVANAIKYLWRYEEKNGLEDVKKAKWYIERLIKELEPNVLTADEDDCKYCFNCKFNSCDEDEFPCSDCRNIYESNDPRYDKTMFRWERQKNNS